jgi:hypothetical protein
MNPKNISENILQIHGFTVIKGIIAKKFKEG